MPNAPLFTSGRTLTTPAHQRFPLSLVFHCRSCLAHLALSICCSLSVGPLSVPWMFKCVSEELRSMRWWCADITSSGLQRIYRWSAGCSRECRYKPELVLFTGASVSNGLFCLLLLSTCWCFFLMPAASNIHSWLFAAILFVVMLYLLWRC